MISGHVFHFYIFQNIFNKLSLLSELCYLFVKILTRYKADLIHGFTMPLHQGYYLTSVYSCIKFYCQRWGDLENFYFAGQRYGIIWKMSLTHKN